MDPVKLQAAIVRVRNLYQQDALWRNHITEDVMSQKRTAGNAQVFLSQRFRSFVEQAIAGALLPTEGSRKELRVAILKEFPDEAMGKLPVNPHATAAL